MWALNGEERYDTPFVIRVSPRSTAVRDISSHGGKLNKVLFWHRNTYLLNPFNQGKGTLASPLAH